MKKIIIGAALLAGFVNINAQTAKKDSLKEKQIEEVEQRYGGYYPYSFKNKRPNPEYFCDFG